MGQAHPKVSASRFNNQKIKVNDIVRVRPGVEPRYKWGSVRPGMLGLVTEVESDGDLKVSDFIYS